jgi:hypothetical protein
MVIPSEGSNHHKALLACNYPPNAHNENQRLPKTAQAAEGAIHMSETIHAQISEYPTINSKTTLDALSQAVKSSDRPSTPLPDPSCPASANPAVARCTQAYADAMESALDRGRHQYDVTREAGNAYRQAMPPLSGHENIRDFIACVAHGMLIDAISGPDGARLLYAAQVAHSALNSPSQSRKPTPTPNPASEPVPETA